MSLTSFTAAADALSDEDLVRAIKTIVDTRLSNHPNHHVRWGAEDVANLCTEMLGDFVKPATFIPSTTHI